MNRERIRTGARTVKITDNVGHTSLVTHNGSQMNGLLGVILYETIYSIKATSTRGVRNAYLGEGLDLSTVTSRTLAGEETKGAMAGRFVLDESTPRFSGDPWLEKDDNEPYGDWKKNWLSQRKQENDNKLTSS